MISLNLSTAELIYWVFYCHTKKPLRVLASLACPECSAMSAGVNWQELRIWVACSPPGHSSSCQVSFSRPCCAAKCSRVGYSSPPTQWCLSNIILYMPFNYLEIWLCKSVSTYYKYLRNYIKYLFSSHGYSKSMLSGYKAAFWFFIAISSVKDVSGLP